MRFGAIGKNRSYGCLHVRGKYLRIYQNSIRENVAQHSLFLIGYGHFSSG